MVTEDYVSFEMAKLLKEKGFDENTNCQYSVGIHYGEVGEYNITDRSRNPENYIPAPTLQMAMKWLRETHSLDIYPHHDYTDGNEKWWFEIIRFPSSYAEYESDSIYLKHEDACEAAIKYCLEKLI